MNINTTLIDDILIKLKRKDPALFNAVQKKINQIAQLDKTLIQHFKNLRGNLKDYKRVHVGSFVLMFKVEEDTIIFARFLHHDDAY
jgi:YafQ family addiction module toxin component